MPELITKPADTNAKVAAKLAGQDIMGQSTGTGEFEDSSTALDKLATAAAAAKSPPPVDDEAAKKVEAEKAAADAEAKAKSDAEAKAREEHTRKADEYFKDVPGLPPGASPKSSEAFATIKIKAAQEIAAREAELEKLRAEARELREKVGKPTAEQEAALKELEDHRTWRAKVDVELDPKFKQFDQKISSTREFIYAQLKQSAAVTDEAIEQIKKFGGPDKVKLDNVFKAIDDPEMQRRIEGKISEIEQTKWEKEEAIRKAKDNIQEYKSTREREIQSMATQHTEATKAALGELTSKLEWFVEKPIAGVADKDKPAVEAHNKFVSDLRANIDVALTDDSPQMRAILVTGMAQLFHFKDQVIPGLKAEAEAARKDAEAARKEVVDLKEKWEKVKSASVSRLSQSQAPASGIMPEKPVDIFNTRTPDALDNIARQVAEKRAAQGNG